MAKESKRERIYEEFCGIYLLRVCEFILIVYDVRYQVNSFVCGYRVVLAQFIETICFSLNYLVSIY